MAVETNQFIDDLKTILIAFELPNNKVMSEVTRLERLRSTLRNQGTYFIDDTVCNSGSELFRHGLMIFKERVDEVN